MKPPLAQLPDASHGASSAPFGAPRALVAAPILLLSFLVAPASGLATSCPELADCLAACTVQGCAEGCLGPEPEAASELEVSFVSCVSEALCWEAGEDAAGCISSTCGELLEQCLDVSVEPPPECPDDASDSGECLGNVWSYCDGGQKTEVDCGATNQVCAIDEQTGAVGCVDTRPAGCPDGLGPEGKCEGTVLTFCNEGEVSTVDCGAAEEVCGLNRASGLFECLDAEVPDELPEEGAPCPADLTFEGECVGDVVVWCEDDVVNILDCGAEGLGCALNEEEGYYDCAAGGDDGGEGPLPGEPCADGLTFEGECQGDTVVWCEDDLTQVFDCSTQGLGCGYNASAKIYDCVEGEDGGGSGGDVPVAGTPCPSDLTFDGACFGDVVAWCENGVTQVIDCEAEGATCELNSAEGYYDCLVGGGGDGGDLEPGSPCPDDLTAEGECQGNVVVWCEDGEVQVLDCSDSGSSCGYNTAEDYFDCQNVGGDGGGSSECGEVTGAGTCDGSTLLYCDGGELFSANCAADGFACGFDQSSQQYDCLGGSPGGVNPGTPILVADDGGCRQGNAGSGWWMLTFPLGLAAFRYRRFLALRAR